MWGTRVAILFSSGNRFTEINMKIYNHKSSIPVVRVGQILLLAGLVCSCESFEPERVVRLSTGPITDLGATSVHITGNIADEGGQEIISRGICYNSQPNPTLSDAYTIEGSGKGEFTSFIYSLVPEITYYARAYATNNDVTIYGNELSFTTRSFIIWKKTLGGSNNDRALSAALCSDGGYYIAGVSASTDGDVTGNHGGDDIWVVKLSASGDKLWQHSYGGSATDECLYIQPIAGGGLIVGGATYSSDGDITSKHNNEDIWILKLFSTGEIDWQRTYGGSQGEWARCIRQTADGGYIVAGTSLSADSDISENHGDCDWCILKLSTYGDIQWQKSYGGSGYDDCFSIRQTLDGQYIVAGASTIGNYDIPLSDFLGTNICVMKLASNGNILWKKVFGGSMNDNPYDIIQTTDGGYLVAGSTLSGDGQVTGYHGFNDAWIVKLNPDGNINWEKSLGGNSNEDARAILQTNDEGYLIAGSSSSSDGDVTVNHGGPDFWIVKLNTGGGVLWEKSFGGSVYEYPYSLVESAEGDIVVAGYSNSNDGDISGNHGSNDFWVMKLDLGD
jgi:hypothetical protein